MTENTDRYRLVDGKYEPVTYDLAFFKGNYQYVADCYKNWVSNIESPRNLKCKEVHISEDNLFETLLPLQFAETKIIFVQCKNGWTVMLRNSPKMQDYTTIMWNMEKKYFLDGVLIRYIPNIYPPKNYKDLDNYRNHMEIYFLVIIMDLEKNCAVRPGVVSYI